MNSSREHFTTGAKKKCFSGIMYRWCAYCKLSL